MQNKDHQNPGAIRPEKRSWEIWWELIRPHTLTAGFVPVLIGTALALQTERVNVVLFAAMLIASLLIQSATNLFNEYYDFKRGLDNEKSVGIGGGIVRHGMSPQFILNLALALYGLALLLGIYICAVSSWWIAAVGLVCMAVGYLYTGGPLPISSTPFGELMSGLFMGFLIILISFYIQTGTVSKMTVLVAIPSGILVGLINFANNIRDHDGDKANGRKTLAILMGQKKSITFMGIMFTFAYLWVIGLCAAGIVSPWLLLVILSVPKAVKAIKGFMGKTIAKEMVPAMIATAQTNTIFGLLLSAGLFISYFL